MYIRYTIGIHTGRACSVSGGLAGSIDLLLGLSRRCLSFLAAEHDNKPESRSYAWMALEASYKTYEWLPFVPDIVKCIFRWDNAVFILYPYPLVACNKWRCYLLVLDP